MTPPVFATVVEGHGEVAALRVLIATVVAHIGSEVYPVVPTPLRVPRGTLLRTPGALENYAAQAIQLSDPRARLLVLLDSDDECPAELGPRLLQRLDSRFPDRPISINVANREYESWFIASAESIAGHIGVDPFHSTMPSNIETIRGAKEWLSRNLLHRRYKETTYQAAFSSAIDVPLARSRSQSFDRFCREVERLLRA